jgi:hypothetical protein
MYLHQHKVNELAVLMDLRLAFGPGTRLWAHRSREELCYDWLEFKARRIDASLRDFAGVLFCLEKKDVFDPRVICRIRRSLVVVLRAHRIKRSRSSHEKAPYAALPGEDPGTAGLMSG